MGVRKDLEEAIEEAIANLWIPVTITAEEIQKHHDLCEEKKKDWPEGPWQEEPHRHEWTHAGLTCLIVRNFRFGNLCGYVGVPEGHPAFGKEIIDVDVQVHGGLTYAAHCNGLICHVSENDRIYWLGFDCAHCYDISPAHEASFWPGNSYRTFRYVKNETEALAEQLAGITA